MFFTTFNPETFRMTKSSGFEPEIIVAVGLKPLAEKYVVLNQKSFQYKLKSERRSTDISFLLSVVYQSTGKLLSTQKLNRFP